MSTPLTRRFSVLPCVFLILTALLFRGSVHAEGKTDPKKKGPPPRFALLVGVGKYPNLGPREQLTGSVNDVAAMKRLLVERFGFLEKNIQTLTDEQATGAGIRKAFQTFIDKVQSAPPGQGPAQAVFHFSGHGSQVPDQPEGHPDHDEEDGLDETIVPHDAKKQGGDEDIRDDDIYKFVNKVCSGGKARLLVVLDCCHSGTGARGITAVRQLTRPDLKPTIRSKNAPPLKKKPLSPGVVVLAACRSREVEPEFRDEEKTYGLLTRFLVQVLSEEKVVSKLSYELLHSAILSRYRSDGRVMQPPVPQLEGPKDLLKTTVLGCGPDVDLPPYFEVKRISSSKAEIRAGAFHSVTNGSIFEVYAQPDHIVYDLGKNPTSSKTVAWLRVTRVHGALSEAEVVQRQDKGKADLIEAQLPASFLRGYAVKRYHEPGPASIRLRVVKVKEDGADGPVLGPGNPAVPKVVTESLNNTKKKGEISWAEWAKNETAPCDLVLRIAGDHAAFFPATGVARVFNPKQKSAYPKSLHGGWGPIDLRKPEATNQIRDHLRRITRARNLIRLAQGDNPTKISDYQLKVELLKVKYDFEKQSVIEQAPWNLVGNDLVNMRKRDVYAVRVTNDQKAGKPIYLTVLKITPNMGIEVIMPDDDSGNKAADEVYVKLSPGEKQDSDPFQVDEADLGTFHVVVLATRERIRLDYISQPDLTRTRGVPRSSGGAASLVESLAEQTWFQPPRSRGQRLRRTGPDTSWHSRVLSWRVVP